ncbi:WYL domain-containing protein [Actinomadura geliboluensis]|uniref:WYL domain-containing protein n=1 Tax=Actinomadura geliboluensis TaxID=882440 RepID=UPI0036C50E1A
MLRLSPDGMHRLSHLAELTVVSEAQKTAVIDPDGWTRVTVPVESHDQAVRELLRLGADVQVLAAAEFRSRMAGTVAAMSRQTTGGMRSGGARRPEGGGRGGRLNQK